MSLPEPGADRTCLVTGASSGIGADIARELAQRGHQVVLVSRSKDPLDRLAEEIGADDVAAHVLPTDLSDRGERARLLDRVADLGLTVDVLVNNAGYSTLGRVAEADPEDEMAMTEVDVVAVQDLCTRVLPGMVERGRGAVLNVASTAAFQPLPGQAGYAAAKSFVLSYTLSLAGELSGTGVTATCLCPGPVHARTAARDPQADAPRPEVRTARARRPVLVLGGSLRLTEPACRSVPATAGQRDGVQASDGCGGDEIDLELAVDDAEEVDLFQGRTACASSPWSRARPSENGRRARLSS